MYYHILFIYGGKGSEETLILSIRKFHEVFRCAVLNFNE